MEDHPSHQPAQPADAPLQQTNYGQEPKSDGTLAIVALVLGIIGLVGWCCPLVGVPITGIGLALGIKERNSEKDTIAMIAIGLCAVGLLLSLGNAGLGAYQAMSGEHAFVEY